MKRAHKSGREEVGRPKVLALMAKADSECTWQVVVGHFEPP